MTSFLQKVKVVWMVAVLSPITLVCGILCATSLWFDRSGQYYHFVSQVWCRSILWAGFVKVQLTGGEKVKWDDTFIIVSNHQSHFDPAVLRPNLHNNHRYLAKMELAKIPVLGWALKYGDDVLIDRFKRAEAAKGLDATEQKLREGKSVVIFAEGTRSEDGVMRPFKRGAFTLAMKTGLPILPVTVMESYKIMPKGKFIMNGGEVKVIVHDPIDTASFMTQANGEAALNELTFNTIAAPFHHSSQPAPAAV